MLKQLYEIAPWVVCLVDIQSVIYFPLAIYFSVVICFSWVIYFQKGDIILTVNGTSLWNMSHTDAVNNLKANANSKAITLKVLEGDRALDGSTRYSPSWLTWLTLPQ